MNTLVSVDAMKLATGMQQILLDMFKEHGKAAYPIYTFERMITKRKKLSLNDAKEVTRRVLELGIIRKDENNCFVL